VARGQSITEAIEPCLEKYNLLDKVRYVITDNASNKRKASSVQLTWTWGLPALVMRISGTIWNIQIWTIYVQFI